MTSVDYNLGNTLAKLAYALNIRRALFIHARIKPVVNQSEQAAGYKAHGHVIVFTSCYVIGNCCICIFEYVQTCSLLRQEYA